MYFGCWNEWMRSGWAQNSSKSSTTGGVPTTMTHVRANSWGGLARTIVVGTTKWQATVRSTPLGQMTILTAVACANSVTTGLVSLRLG
jgi:hypothetical protein